MRELHGLDSPLGEEIHLRAGEFEAVFEPAHAYFRRVRRKGIEIVRNCYLHVRGPDWSTVLPSVRMVTHEVGENHFLLEWTAEHVKGEIDFEWRGTLTGSPSGLVYRCDCRARKRFSTNRTGLCVLIPAEFAGADVLNTHANAAPEVVHLEEYVVPKEPLRDVRALDYGGARVTFQGDAFEAEDQRNWSDNSYKAYPLRGRRAGPYLLEAGETFTHEVAIEPSPIEPERTRRTPVSGKIPLIGARVEDDAVDLAGLPIEFLRVEAGTGEMARQRLEHARSTQLPLHVVREEPEGIEVESGGTHVLWARVGTFDQYNLSRPRLGEAFRGLEFEVTPQVHTFDERSILENARSLCEVVRTAGRINPGKALGINLYLSKEADPRLESLFGALWVLASAIAAGTGGADSMAVAEPRAFRTPCLQHLLEELKDSPRFQMLDDDPAEVVGARLIRDGGEKHWLIGNLLRESRIVEAPIGAKSLFRLTAQGWMPAKIEKAVALGPYEIAQFRS